jgi:hypothetical protein
MSKIKFVHKNGRVQTMPRRFADVLQKLGRGSYLTRDMTAATGGFVDAGPAYLVGTQDIADTYPQKGDGLDKLDAVALHALAKVRGVKVHHNAGAEKVRQAIREASEQ